MKNKSTLINRSCIRKATHTRIFVVLLGLVLFLPFTQANAQYKPPERLYNQSSIFQKDNITRPLRYRPDGTDFVISNGAEFFNRPLYGGSSPFRVDGGDKPEFSLYLPGRGGNLRLGIKTSNGVKWLNDARHIVTRYRPGSLLYEIRDPLLGGGVLRLSTLALTEIEGMVVRAELDGTPSATELIWAFGGVDGMRGRRDGDIGCETEPVGSFFQLRASQCADNVVTISNGSFQVQGKPGTIVGVVPQDAKMFVGNATDWDKPAALLTAPKSQAHELLLVGQVNLRQGHPLHLALYQLSKGKDADETLSVYREVAAEHSIEKSSTRGSTKISAADLPHILDLEEKRRRAIAEHVIVVTPDPFINAAAAALNIAADAVWDDRRSAYLHGGVAWRVRLLGWRVGYTGDTLGWHERSAAHFTGYAKQQNTDPIPAVIPPPEESANLARNETALQSNGDMTKSHYDMNLVGVDVFFRHLLWTGDLEYAREMWPTIERHLAWERRLFRREYGSEKLPLYEAYCCIWASDDVAYNGGGATHSTAYNLYHNRMAARVAKLIGKDPTPYEREAELIAKAMRSELWLKDGGWFAEYKDLLGLQLVHPNAAAWAFYHTVDSEVPSSLEAWQMTRAVDSQITRFPMRGPGVPDGNCTMSTTSWMPYSWSVNNVVLAETMHTALGYWQTGRTEGAFPLFKGAVLDSMYLGLCPGNVGMATYFDAYRRESQRDFGDGVGSMSRALVEGLFGAQPDALAGELKIRPGFPAEWSTASIRHPDFNFTFRRDGLRETFKVEQKFAKPMALHLQIAALRDQVTSITANGRALKWQLVEDGVGKPQIKIQVQASAQQEVIIEWKGRAIDSKLKVINGPSFARGAEVEVKFGADELSSVKDPQGVLSGFVMSRHSFKGKAAGIAGPRTLFAKLRQGAMTWWQPVEIEIRPDSVAAVAVDWNKPLPGSARLDMVNLAAQFNDKVTQIFRNEYRSPRSPFCSLALPKQGIGSWCNPQGNFIVDDSGLRAEAAQAGGKIILPNGVPLATPGASDAKNIAFVSQWDNYPREITLPLTGRASRAILLMAGSTNAMQSRFDNGEVIATYTDGSSKRLALHNPTTWWPIDQDYYIDDYAFARPEPLPVRVDLKTGKIRVLQMESFKGQGRTVPGGAATVLDLPLDTTRELKSLTVRAIANQVVIGLMSVTLQR